jgi:cell division protein FtsQ
MKAYKSVIFLTVMILLLGGLFWFSHYKNSARAVSDFKISFTHSPLLLDTLLVNKLLTQNLDAQLKLLKESLDLNMLETQLKRTPEVKNIEVFKLPQGRLAVELTERKPIFEVASSKHYFGDAKGILFAYQSIDTLSLPIFKTDSSSTSLASTADLIAKLKMDPLLEIELEEISLKNNQYTLELKSFPFEVVLGDSTELRKKLEKLKIFCAFQTSQDSLNGYDKINLSYENQVVATIL